MPDDSVQETARKSRIVRKVAPFRSPTSRRARAQVMAHRRLRSEVAAGMLSFARVLASRNQSAQLAKASRSVLPGRPGELARPATIRSKPYSTANYRSVANLVPCDATARTEACGPRPHWSRAERRTLPRSVRQDWRRKSRKSRACGRKEPASGIPKTTKGWSLSPNGDTVENASAAPSLVVRPNDRR